MAVLQLNSYIAFVRDIKKREPHTIVNYENAIKYTGVREIDTSQLDTLFANLLSKLEGGLAYGYIQNLMKVIRGTLKLHGAKWDKGYNYNVLVAKLEEANGSPMPYTFEEINQLLRVCQRDMDVFKLITLCTFSLLRIGACKDLKFSKFRKMSNGVYVFTVYPNADLKDQYIAGISEYGYNWLQKMNLQERDEVIAFDADVYKTDFEGVYRERLKDIAQRYGLGPILQNKQPFHAFRKFAMERLTESGMDDDDIALLSGHIPDTTANMHYVKNIEVFGPKVAEIYAKSQLNNLRFEL